MLIAWAALCLTAIAFDPYRVLGVPTTASQEEINAVFRSRMQSLQLDSDMDRGSEVRKAGLEEAHRILGGTRLRQEHDRHRKASLIDEGTLYLDKGLFEEFVSRPPKEPFWAIYAHPSRCVSSDCPISGHIWDELKRISKGAIRTAELLSDEAPDLLYQLLSARSNGRKAIRQHLVFIVRQGHVVARIGLPTGLDTILQRISRVLFENKPTQSTESNPKKVRAKILSGDIVAVQLQRDAFSVQYACHCIRKYAKCALVPPDIYQKLYHPAVEGRDALLIGGYSDGRIVQLPLSLHSMQSGADAASEAVMHATMSRIGAFDITRLNYRELCYAPDRPTCILLFKQIKDPKRYADTLQSKAVDLIQSKDLVFGSMSKKEGSFYAFFKKQANTGNAVTAAALRLSSDEFAVYSGPLSHLNSWLESVMDGSVRFGSASHDGGLVKLQARKPSNNDDMMQAFFVVLLVTVSSIAYMMAL